MRIKSVREGTIIDLESRAKALIVACGYEHRSLAVTSQMNDLPTLRHALSFKEHASAIARPQNEKYFWHRGFTLDSVSSNEPHVVQSVVHQIIESIDDPHKAVAFDISTMTRTWHGAIIRQLRVADYGQELETFFAYVPSQFRPPPGAIPNEFVSPVDGFASLSTPDLPVAAIIGLGYEKDGALGLQQLLDPALTILFVPNSGKDDRYHSLVKQNNREVLKRTPPEWVFEYSISEPASTFSVLASLVGGIRQSYRIVLASLGPKIFGLLCFLLSTRFPDVSVWRVSSGIHGQPRDAYGDMTRLVVLDVIWEP